MNSSNSLDLYAKVEDLLGVKEVAPTLYAHYLLFLNTVNFDRLLDVGCGSGDFLRQMKRALDIPAVLGIDLSPEMVRRTQSQGLEAQCIDLCSLEGRYDVITAVFDMLNYLDHSSLQHFLSCVDSHLNEGGYFLCDINTLYGFEEVAVGSFIVDDDTRFLTIDSEFDQGIYCSEFTLFEQKDRCFTKSKEMIKQFYHTVEEILALSGLELLVKEEISLYDTGDTDKIFLVLSKG